MAANHRNLGETLRQPGQIHGSRFRWAVVAARQPRRPANFEPSVDIDMHIQFRREPHDRIVIRMTARYPLFPVPGYFIPMQGPLRIHFSILAQLSSGKPGSMGVRPERRSLSRSRILRMAASYGYGANGSSNVPPTSCAMERSMPMRSTKKLFRSYCSMGFLDPKPWKWLSQIL